MSDELAVFHGISPLCVCIIRVGLGKHFVNQRLAPSKIFAKFLAKSVDTATTLIKNTLIPQQHINQEIQMHYYTLPNTPYAANATDGVEEIEMTLEQIEQICQDWELKQYNIELEREFLGMDV